MNFLPSISIPFFGGSGGITGEVYARFRSHIDLLYDLKRKADQDIDAWATSLTYQIRDHAYNQKRLIDTAFQNQRKYLEEVREQYVEAGLIYTSKGNTEEINRLLEKCRTLEVVLVDLKFYTQATKFIEVTAKESIDSQDTNEPRVISKISENQPIQRTDTVVSSNRDLNLNRSYSSSTPITTATRINETSTTMSNLSTPYNDSNRLQASAAADTKSYDKCPVCFMIFPSDMSEMSRSIHVDRHYEDT